MSLDRRKTLATSLMNITKLDVNALTVIKSNSMPSYHIGIVTAGEYSQGMNAAIRAAARTGFYMGCRVSYIKHGFQGMVDGGASFEEATWKSTSDIIGMGGSMLKSYKCPDILERTGRLKAARNLVNSGIQAIVAIGGDGTLKGLSSLYNEWDSLLEELEERNLADKSNITKSRHMKIVVMLASITNDLTNADVTIGFNSALHRITEAIDNITSTCSSSQQAFVVQVMGQSCGYLALASGLTSDASMIFIPEWPPVGNWRDELCDKVRDDIYMGSEGIICITCEGAIDRDGKPITAEEIRDTLQTRLHLNARITILGQVQRGGDPTALDRTIATRMGVEAVSCLKDIPEEDGPSVITFRGSSVICLPLADVLESNKKLETSLRERNYADALRIRGKTFQFHLSNYNLLHSLRSSPVSCMDIPGARRIGLVRVGRSTINHCIVIRTIVAYCHYKTAVVYSFKHGFSGVANGEYRVLTWDIVKHWTNRANVCLDHSLVHASDVGLEKIAGQLENLGVSGLIVIGNFEAYKSLAEISEAKNKYKGLCIPMCLVPVSMTNNIPGSEITIGADTTLNEIIQYCDKLKRVARDENNRVFIIETMGQNCGYLPTACALCVGADAAYIKQEMFNLDTLLEDANHLRQKILNSGVNIGLIICGDKADENYNTDFIMRVFTEEGKGVYSCRASTIGHVQLGGLPSVFDRLLGGAAGLKAAEWIYRYLDRIGIEEIRCDVSSDSRSVLCFNRQSLYFVPIKNLICETDFTQELPTYLPWMRLRPINRILAKHEDVVELDFMEETEDGDIEEAMVPPVDT